MSPLQAFFIDFGRNGGIRTHDPLHPMQVRYQAALRPENIIIHEGFIASTLAIVIAMYGRGLSACSGFGDRACGRCLVFRCAGLRRLIRSTFLLRQ